MKTITVSGTTLFHVAADELRDATQWVRIAKANNLSDPVITTPTQLLIPDIDPNAGGGIDTQ